MYLALPLALADAVHPCTQRENEAQFRSLVDLLDQPSLVANARQALAAIATPQVKAVGSRADRMSLSFGNPETHPDSSLVMHVDVKKAVVPAAAPTMKQMSMRGFERVRSTQRAQQRQSQGQGQSQAFSQLLGGGGPHGEARGTKREADRLGEMDEDEDEDAKAEVRRKARFAAQQNREQQAQMAAGQGMDFGKIGMTLDRQLENDGLAVGTAEDADLAGHGVIKERHYFYRPPPVTTAATNGKDKAKSAKVSVSRRPRDGGIVEEDVYDEDDDDEQLVSIDQDTTELTDAYHYGGSLVPIGDLEEGAGVLGGLKTGMEILNFMKQSDVRPDILAFVALRELELTPTSSPPPSLPLVLQLHYDWRMGDVFYVYAMHGELGSEKIFSALVNGMVERDSLAVVRFVKKGFTRDGKVRLPDPQLGILFPHIEDGIEICYWVRVRRRSSSRTDCERSLTPSVVLQIPFAEDVRALTFPSLDRLFNRKGQPLAEHKFLPTAEMDAAMDALVDSMDLTKAGPPDEDGCVLSLAFLCVYMSFF